MLTLKTRRQKLEHLTFSHDGKKLAVCGQFGGYMWSIPFDESMPLQFGESSTWRGEFLGSDLLVLSALTDGIRIHNIRNSSFSQLPLEQLDAPHFATSPTDSILLTHSWESQNLSAWRVDSDNQVEMLWQKSSIPVRGWKLGPGFSTDGNSIAVMEGVQTQPYTNVLTTCESKTGKVIRSTIVQLPAFTRCVISPSRLLVCYAHNSKLVLIDDAKLTVIDHGNPKLLTDIAFHPSGRYLAATSNDATVKLYDTETWQVAQTFTWNIGRLRSVAFSPDGVLAAVGSDTGKIVVWDVDL